MNGQNYLRSTTWRMADIFRCAVVSCGISAKCPHYQILTLHPLFYILPPCHGPSKTVDLSADVGDFLPPFLSAPDHVLANCLHHCHFCHKSPKMTDLVRMIGEGIHQRCLVKALSRCPGLVERLRYGTRLKDCLSLLREHCYRVLVEP